MFFFTDPKLIYVTQTTIAMGNVSTQTLSNFNPPPTKPLPPYVPSHFLFPPPTTFTISCIEDTLPGDYTVLHRKLMKQEPPPSDPEGWHPDY